MRQPIRRPRHEPSGIGQRATEKRRKSLVVDMSASCLVLHKAAIVAHAINKRRNARADVLLIDMSRCTGNSRSPYLVTETVLSRWLIWTIPVLMSSLPILAQVTVLESRGRPSLPTLFLGGCSRCI